MHRLLMLKLQRICKTPEWEQLKPEWIRLFDTTPSATPFQSPTWLMGWWRHFGNDQLRTIALRDNERLVGLFPLYIDTKNDGYRELKFVGTGISDYLDGIVAPGYESVVLESLFDFLRDSSAEWDLCNLEQLPSASPILHQLPEFIVPADSCLRAALPRSLEEWHRCISPNLSRDIRYSWRRAESLGIVAFECATHSNLDSMIEAFFGLHAARWSVRGETSGLTNVELQKFHCEVGAGLLADGMLRLGLLTLNGKSVAGVYAFIDRGCLYIYLTGFDPQFAKFSFGSLAISAAIEMAIHEGCSTVDFLRGRESYKFRFGANENPLVAFRCPAEALRQFIPFVKSGSTETKTRQLFTYGDS